MNTRYTEIFLFLSRLSRRSNKGFALGFALCAGVLMAGTGAVMLMRSSSEREKVIAQQATAKGKTAGEVAIARMQYLLGKYPFLAEMKMMNWQNADVESHIKAQIQNTCEGRALTQPEINAKVEEAKTEIAGYIQKDGEEYAWLKMDESQPNKGQFRFVDFDPAIAGKKMGTITIEAMANVDNTFKEAPTRLEVTIPLSENEVEIKEGEGPGLWLRKGNGFDRIIAAHVWIGSGGEDCSVTDDLATINNINQWVFGTGGGGKKAEGGLKQAIDNGELLANTTFKPAMVAEHKFPDELPDIPDNAIDMDKTTSNSSGLSCGTQVDASKNGDWTVFPRPNHSATRKQIMDDGTTLCIYDYKGTVAKNSTNVIRTVNAEGNHQRVIFHISKDLDSPNLLHIADQDISSIKQENKLEEKYNDCEDLCRPVDFQIFGHPGTNKIRTNGNNRVNAFIWAPDASVVVNGAAQEGAFNGVIFADSWSGGSNTSNVQFVQTGEWDDLGIETPEVTPPMTVGQPANIKSLQYHSSDSE